MIRARPNWLKGKDMMAGIAIGDAYGAGYEGASSNDVGKTANINQYVRNPYHQEHQAGHYTDDGQMSLAVSELLLSREEFNSKNLFESLRNAYTRDKRPGYSRTTKEALETGDFGSCRTVKQLNRNGAITRSVPIGVLSDPQKVINYAILNSELCHKTPQSITSGVFVALASHFMFHDSGEPECIFSFCKDEMSASQLAAFDEKTMEYLCDVSEMDKLDTNLLLGEEYENFGVPIDSKITAGAVLYVISKYSDNPQKILEAAISLGGDADTVASTALGVVATRTGLDEIPASLVSDFEEGPYGLKYFEYVGKRLAALAPINVMTIKRNNYPGRRNNMVVHGLDGIIEPTDAIYLEEVMGGLMRDIDYRPGDYILALDSTGYILGVAASRVTGLQVINAKKADLDARDKRIETKVEFEEPGSLHSQLFAYNMPRGARVIVVDDEIMTGDTLVDLIRSFNNFGIDIAGVVVPIEATKYDARSRIENEGCKLISHTVHDLE